VLVCGRSTVHAHDRARHALSTRQHVHTRGHYLVRTGQGNTPPAVGPNTNFGDPILSQKSHALPLATGVATSAAALSPATKPAEVTTFGMPGLTMPTDCADGELIEPAGRLAAPAASVVLPAARCSMVGAVRLSVSPSRAGALVRTCTDAVFCRTHTRDGSVVAPVPSLSRCKNAVLSSLDGTT
jgi:hypothetical protein